MTSRKQLFVTGGAGFIAVHTCSHFASKGWDVCLVDNLSRRGANENLKWLQDRTRCQFERCDIRDLDTLSKVIAKVRPDAVIHLAAQVAVTTSVSNPREDFEINALGTFNVLDCVRKYAPEAFVLNVSTNKVYGKMDSLGITEREGRYEYRDLPQGVSETFPLDFHSPYGCSKGAADQYAIDFGRIYGIRTTTFRQSCIYGTRQFGIEDQGWVAWFSIAATLGKHISVFGDGKQTRDVLNVSDLVAAYEAAISNAESANGQAFNIGGGPANMLSLLELLAHLDRHCGRKVEYSFHPWRPGDQLTFVCDTSKAKRLLNWEPKISVQTGVEELICWTRDHSALFADL